MAEKTAQEAPLARLVGQGVATTSERVPKNSAAHDRAAFEAAESRVSLLLAAGCRADPAFPSEASLPRVASIPYNHLGHLPLLNYDFLCESVWGTARHLREERRKHSSTSAWVVAALVLAACTFGGYRLDNIVLGGAVGAVLALVAFVALAEDFSKRAAALRAEAIECLLEGHVPCAATMPPDFLPVDEARIQFGDGLVGTSEVPVFFAGGPQDPFPGLGRVQARELFLCPSRDLEETILIDSEKLHARVLADLESAADMSGLPNILRGEAIVVDSASISKDSAWLDGKGRPFLYVSKTGPFDVASVDPGASARLYAGLQVLLPDCLTCISFFVRPFFAGTAAAFEMFVITLGPPTETVKSLQEILHYHRAIAGRESRSRRASAPARQPPSTGVTSQIEFIQRLTESRSDPLAASKLTNLASLTPHGVRDREESRVVAALQDQHPDWIGRHMRLASWRETHSLTLTDDLFGATECKVVVRALYQQLARAVLTTFDALGFDIDQHRDASGRWTIQADALERMVAGERIDAAATTREDGKPVQAG